jgi:hypothetical protein
MIKIKQKLFDTQQGVIATLNASRQRFQACREANKVL